MKNRKRISQILLAVTLGVLCILILFPLWLVLSVSLSNEKDIIFEGYKMIPKTLDFSAYKYVFKNPSTILQAYKITAIFSFSKMILSVFFMTLFAYPLTRKACIGRQKINFIIYFTMLFGGGLVPTYILNTQYLHLNNTIWIYILPGLVNPWYVFMIRTFMKQIPGEISESAEIDGASEYLIYAKMMIPLCKPVIAAVALFTLLGSWNDWFTSMLYIDDQKLVSLQFLLQRIMNNIKALQEAAKQGYAVTNQGNIPSETARMAMAVIVAGPALLVFPFFQKYFVKGMTVGSVKG